MAGNKASIRSMYRDLIRECDAGVRRGELAAASVFVTWGSNGSAATEDLYGAGYPGGRPNGYQDLVSTVKPEQRIVFKWCWELFFSMLFIVTKGRKGSQSHQAKLEVQMPQRAAKRETGGDQVRLPPGVVLKPPVSVEDLMIDTEHDKEGAE